MRTRIRRLLAINWFTTIRANLRALGLRAGLKLPVHFEWGSRVTAAKGSIHFSCPTAPGLVRFGRGSSLDVAGRVLFRGSASFGEASAIHVARDAELHVGANLVVTSKLSLNCLRRIELGDDTLLAWSCTILDGDFHPIRDETGKVLNENRPIHLGSRVWIGNNVIILKGVRIADGSVVGAGSVVSRSLPDERCVYAGSPARKLRENIRWDPF